MENTALDRENTWLSIQQAAEHLGVNPRTVRRYIRLDRLAVSRISNKVVRVRLADIDRFIETGVGKAPVAVDGKSNPKTEALATIPRPPARPAQPATASGFTPGRFA